MNRSPYQSGQSPLPSALFLGNTASWISAVFALTIFLVAIQFDPIEHWVLFTEHHEELQIDELPLAFLFFAAWYAWLLRRRNRENKELLARLNREIAAKESAERQLRQALEESHRALVELEHAGQAKTLLLANVSHELRTPLNAIIGFSSMMEEEILGPINIPRYKGYATDINKSAHYLLALIEDILDVSRLSRDDHTLTEASFGLTELLEDVNGIIAGQAGSKGIVLHAPPPPPEISLTGDYRILKQALLNLLTNAMKFTPAGGRVSLTGNLSADGGLDLTVSDTGIGIAQKNLQQIFQPFFQVADPHCRTTSGSGLGLAIVQRVVDLHDGHIAVSSQLGKGTQMKITLPASRIARGHKHPG